MSHSITRGVYAITEPSLHANTSAMISACEAAMQGGIRWLQYRHKNALYEDKLAIAQALQKLSQTYQVPLMINDDMQLARAVGAAGVHLGQEDGCVAEARALLGEQAIIGVTCHHHLSLAHQAIKDGASYVAFGRFFASTTKPNAVAAPLSALTDASQAFAHTLVAIGGINQYNAAQVISAGAHMIAVAHGLFAAADITAEARKLAALAQA